MLKTPVSGALALGLMAVAPAAAAEHVRASWYGGGHERLNARTASGESFNPRALTCAHRSLPFGTRLRVTYRGRSIVVRVNDRGPNIKTGRALDLSRSSAAVLGMTRAGVALVSLERL